MPRPRGPRSLALPVVVLLGLLLPRLLPAQTAPYRLGAWNQDSLGNQRVVVRVDSTLDLTAVRVLIPWRRRDPRPEQKRVIVTDALGNRVADVLALSVRSDSGDIVFRPRAGMGNYFLYYLPYSGTVRSNYPKISYPAPDSSADLPWDREVRARRDQLPRAHVVAFESADSMSLLWPMEVAATQGEVAVRRAAAGAAAFVVFPEDRTRPIKMLDLLPQRWIGDKAPTVLTGTADRDEYFSFQLGVWALRRLDSLTAAFTSLRGPGGRTIPATAFNCITTDGVDWVGQPFHRRVPVVAGEVSPLWCGVMVPRGSAAGPYRGRATVRAAGGASVEVPIDLEVTEQVAVRHGDDEPWRLSRLRWLDSRLAASGAPTPPYTPVRGTPATGFTVLGRRILLGAGGFPRQITSYFDGAMTGTTRTGREMLQAPITLTLRDSLGSPMRWVDGGTQLVSRSTSRAEFSSRQRAGALSLTVRGTLEFDGNLEYTVALAASRTTALSDVRLELPFRPDVARYFMGMNRPGGLAPETYAWSWDVKRNQDAVWVGDVNAGVQLTLKDEHYVRPLNTNFYQLQPLVMPRSWSNSGKGGCRFARGEAVYRVSCGSGAHTITVGDTLYFNFRLLVTPFHTLDPSTHFATRYYHAFKPVDTVRAAGANLVNVHHATRINPWINYPFLRAAAMLAYADSLHDAGMRFKVYYTVRELSYHAPELWALRTLGTEVLATGPGGGHSWLQEHMQKDYITGWVVPELRDVALVTSGVSRWHNFYVEGMQWLVEHAGVDGIYLDDVAFDRTTMQRIRRVLTAHGTPGERIDLHSANQFNPSDGFASSANLYLEHFPYIDRLWFGEYFNYDSPPDYWLVELSGIPFGLMGEMLQGGGNRWRGMLFGMTARLPWAGDPRPEWQEWDEFGIGQSRMRGWWAPDTPVRTDHPAVLATTYQRAGRSLVALASWAPDTVRVRLTIDWKRLGLDSTRVRLEAMAIDSFQPHAEFAPGEAIPVAPGRGWLLRLAPFDAHPAPR
ncbi:MAG: glycoside hydrolase domain-containing protein [Gemmatimonadota bacterium]